MFKGSSGIQGVSKTLQTDFLSAVTQLLDVYKTQLQAAGDVLSAGTNAALSQVGALRDGCSYSPLGGALATMGAG